MQTEDFDSGSRRVVSSSDLLIARHPGNPITKRAIEYIKKTPGAIEGQNGSNKTFGLICRLFRLFNLPPEVVRFLVAEYYNPKCVPEWSDLELDHKIKDAQKAVYGAPWKPSDTGRVSPSEALENVDKFIQGVRGSESYFLKHSSVEIPCTKPMFEFHKQALLLLTHLYEDGELVNIVTKMHLNNGKFKPLGRGLTMTRERWIEGIPNILPQVCNGALIRMNPMKNTTGVTNQDVAFFRYTLIEFDELEPSKQLAVFQKLNLPISAIVWSGRRSYHAWVRVDAANLDSYNSQVAKLHETLSKFGVDTQTKPVSRLSRLPGVCRGNNKQKLIYIKQ